MKWENHNHQDTIVKCAQRRLNMIFKADFTPHYLCTSICYSQ